MVLQIYLKTVFSSNAAPYEETNNTLLWKIPHALKFTTYHFDDHVFSLPLFVIFEQSIYKKQQRKYLKTMLV